MIRKSVTVIIVNPGQKILLQLRDNKKNILFPNSWCTPGGFIEKGENPEEAAKRELFEELEFKADNLEFFKIYNNYNLETYSFIYHTDMMDDKDIVFHEGQAVKFFSLEEIKNIKIGFHTDVLLKDFFTET